MKVAIPVEGNVVAPVFARAPAFAIIEINENGEVTSQKTIPNPAANYPRGAGIMAVQTLINEGVDSVAVPQVGPNAADALAAAGIAIYQVSPGAPLETVVKMIASGSVTRQILQPAPALQPVPAYPGAGWGMGRGFGRRRGMGRGMGRGFGRGRGMGRSFGRGKGHGRGWFDW